MFLTVSNPTTTTPSGWRCALSVAPTVGGFLLVVAAAGRDHEVQVSVSVFSETKF